MKETLSKTRGARGGAGRVVELVELQGGEGMCVNGVAWVQGVQRGRPKGGDCSDDQGVKALIIKNVRM